ncbi:MAG: 50S ribosomal protein L18 [Gammaproteobacteria bacterium]|nr:50S ribosomal protein L18 [Gammaproteobacteria bacterium]NNC58099.1 50S ribosomal protein L18 [Woeseiaceae bacterium]
MDKKQSRLRRARRGRAKIRELEAVRLSVHRTPRHIYAQVIASADNQILVSASSLEAEVRKGIKNGGNVEAAAIVGARIAEKAKAAGIDTVAFDRSGFRYHGRVKALADAAREAGLKF